MRYSIGIIMLIVFFLPKTINAVVSTARAKMPVPVENRQAPKVRKKGLKTWLAKRVVTKMARRQAKGKRLPGARTALLLGILALLIGNPLLLIAWAYGGGLILIPFLVVLAGFIVGIRALSAYKENPDIYSPRARRPAVIGLILLGLTAGAGLVAFLL